MVDPAVARGAIDREVSAARARLVALSAELEAIQLAAIDANGDDEHDPEGATIAFERARITDLRLRALAQLDVLDRARARLDNGSFAVCACCGGEIARERLIALPAVATCVLCADRANR